MDRPLLTSIALFTLAAACGGQSHQDAPDNARSGIDGGTGGVGASGGSATGGAGTTGGVGGSAAAGAGSKPDEFPTRLEIYGLAHAESGFVATGALFDPDTLEGEGVIYHSVDGLDWKVVAEHLDVIPWDVEYGSDRFVALGSYTDGRGVKRSAGFVSTDGEHWTTVALPVSDVGTRMAFGAGRFVGAGDEGIIVSTDGMSWTRDSAVTYALGAEFAGGNFVVWSSDTSVLVGDGSAAWKAVTMSDIADLSGFEIRALNGVFVGSLRTSSCFEGPDCGHWWRTSSIDGLSWLVDPEELESPPPIPVIDDGNVCVAFAGNWSVLGGPSCDALEPTFGDPLYPVQTALAVDGLYLIGGSFGGILTSTDGATWTETLWMK